MVIDAFRLRNVIQLIGILRAWDKPSAAELDWYPGVEFPDPRLEKLGVELGTIEEFARTTLKAHVGA